MIRLRRIVVIGASSAEGQGDPEGGGYVGRLAKWFVPKGTLVEPHHLFNLGISGDYMAGIVQRLQDEVPRRRPHVIILQASLNDTKREPTQTSPCHTSLSEFSTHLSQAIEIAQQQAPVVLIGLQAVDASRTQPVSWGNFYYTPDDVRQYAAAVAQVAKQRNVPYIPVGEAWAAMGPDAHLPFLAADGLHPNAAGHQWICDRIKEVLVKEFGVV